MSNEGGMQWGWKSVGTAEPAPAAPQEEKPQSSWQPSGTFIGSGALFEGTLTLRGDFRIDSEFRGELTTESTIVVGPSGSVVGDIRAREVQVMGAVVGNITARRQLVLHPGSRTHGDVETACLEIQRHAFFQGRTQMTEPQQIRRSEPARPAADAQLPAPPVA